MQQLDKQSPSRTWELLGYNLRFENESLTLAPMAIEWFNRPELTTANVRFCRESTYQTSLKTCQFIVDEPLGPHFLDIETEAEIVPDRDC